MGLNEEFLLACESGDLQKLDELLSGDIDVNFQDTDGCTGLHLATLYGHKTIVTQLLSHSNIKVNIGEHQGFHPLHIAALCRKLNIVSLLLDQGADVDAEDHTGQNPLFMACMGGHLETLKLLIDRGGAPGAVRNNGMNLLHVASFHGQTQMLPYLLELGFDVNSRDKDGITPVYLAAQGGNEATITTLLEAGGDPTISDDVGLTPLHMAASEGHDPCVQALLPKSNIDHAAEGVNNYTALMLACQKGYTKPVKLLLMAGADWSVRSNKGKSAIALAAEKGHISCVKLLLLHGAKVRWGHRKSALQLARSKGHNEVVSVLECFKDNPDSLSSMGIEAEATSPVSSGPINIEDCGLYQKALEFVEDLKIHSGYFDKRFNICFCNTCHASRGDNLYYKRGVPPKDYGLPVGWVKLGLKIPARASVIGVMEKWHVAFHGTRVANVDEILSTGELLMAGDVTPVGRELRPPPGHYDDRVTRSALPAGFDIYKFYFSPSIRYAGCDVYAPQWRRADSENVKRSIRIAFQVRVKPGSYEIGPQTIGAKTQIDPRFPNSELEWSTKRRGVTVLVGLLVKVEETIGSKGSAQAEASLPQ